MQAIRSSDFDKTGSTGLSLNTEKTFKTPPCNGCEHREKCVAKNLACERFRYYSSIEAHSRPESYYMERSCSPSRADFIQIYGGDDLEPVIQNKASKAEILEAIEAAKSAPYPGDGSPRVRQIVGSRRAWEARQAELVAGLRKCLVEA